MLFSVTRAEIDRGQLEKNYKILKSLAPDCELMCIMKADGYGHGAAECAKTLWELGARCFGVANIDEALELRRALGQDADILILSFTPPQYADLLAQNDIMQTVMSKEYAIALSSYCSDPIRVQLKINTGMNRIGFGTDDADIDDIAEIMKLPKLIFDGIFTHYACADDVNNPMTALQEQRFEGLLERLRALGFEYRHIHTCNSSAYINFPRYRKKMSRCGIVLYGLYPSDNMTDIGIRPIMSLKSSVSQIHTLKKGESVSYGAVYTAEKDSVLATVQMGYADGFIRGYSGGSVYINGQKCPIRGRICMDQFVCDITDAGRVRMGDDVILFDADHPVDLLSSAAGTINYESICMISKRVPRIYVK